VQRAGFIQLAQLFYLDMGGFKHGASGSQPYLQLGRGRWAWKQIEHAAAKRRENAASGQFLAE